MSFARELTSVPQMDTGAPIPLVLASEDRVLLSYLSAEKCASQQCAVVSFEGVRTHSFGFPGDETLSSHSLWGKGITFYAAFEVADSDWIGRLQEMDSIHPQHQPERFRLLKHFIFTFHSSTFECVAQSMTFTTLDIRETSELLGYMAKTLQTVKG
jgi:hypothetical protein